MEESRFSVHVRTVHQTGDATLAVVVVGLRPTVRDLKGVISRAHPAHPAPDAQRLIMAGRVLDDEVALAVAFATVRCFEGLCLVIHLCLPVCEPDARDPPRHRRPGHRRAHLTVSINALTVSINALTGGNSSLVTYTVYAVDDR